jgi:hypothetical protein
MLDKFEQVYTEKKTKLYVDLKLSENLPEKRRVLDDFFESIEIESSRIKNTKVYRAFKNLNLTGANI